MRTPLITIATALLTLTIPLGAAARNTKQIVFSGQYKGLGQEIRASVSFNPRSRTLSIRSRSGLHSTHSTRHTQTLKARIGSPKTHNLMQTIYYVGARPVDKISHGIYLFKDCSGKPTNSMRKPEGTSLHRIHVPNTIKVDRSAIKLIAEQALGVQPGRYNSVITWR